MTTADVLLAARALYEANPSHVPGGLFPSEGCHCPVTALSCVWSQDLRRTQNAASHTASMVILRRVMDGGPITDWNAEHSTEEVLEAFDRAIAEAA